MGHMVYTFEAVQKAKNLFNMSGISSRVGMFI
jgi:hypothetical protein